MTEGLIIDLFAGGGGASEGLERALGRPVDIAINHDREAICMHQANHPRTKHFCEDIFSEKCHPSVIVGDRPVYWLHASPDCKHFSLAKGAKPLDKNIRALASVVLRWARACRPRNITVENVREFMGWGPLLGNNRPDPQRKGRYFQSWLGCLRLLGYHVDYKMLNASQYGAPTKRERFFLVARLDGPVQWPEPTHGPGQASPFRTAAECLDWSLPCPSIFLTRDEARRLRRETGIRCQRPLEDATMERIAKGVVQYVIQAQEPFIVTCNHGGGGFRGQSTREPLSTITAARDARGLVIPILSKYHGAKGGESRCYRPDQPLGTLDTSNRYGLVAAFLSRHFGNSIGQSITAPAPTATGINKTAIVDAHLTKFYGTNTGAPLSGPAPTITANGQHLGIVAAFLMKYYKSGGQWQGSGEPLHTIVAKARFGLVTVFIEGEEWVITDIGMRMFTPRELFLCQGFREDYIIDPDFESEEIKQLDLFNGPKKLTQEAQVRMVGNSVPPDMEEAVVRANMLEREEVAA